MPIAKPKSKVSSRIAAGTRIKKSKKRSKAKSRATRTAKAAPGSASKLRGRTKAKPRASAGRRLTPTPAVEAQPLGFDLGYRIVSVAINRVTSVDSLMPELTIAEVLPSPVQRDVFERAFQDVLKGYTTRSIISLPQGTRTTVSALATMVGSLPGNSGTRDGG